MKHWLSGVSQHKAPLRQFTDQAPQSSSYRIIQKQKILGGRNARPAISRSRVVSWYCFRGKGPDYSVFPNNLVPKIVWKSSIEVAVQMSS